MCGIAGGVARAAGARPDTERVRQMSRLVAHRGPDAEGAWTSPAGHAAFAHRRLSIIDLATGQQPMVDESGTVGLVFNGEIYNYRELRRELQAQGVAFRTDSDTEVLLRLYLRDGPACVHALRGMFAFAVWDEPRRRLTLARDRAGKKPLYYTTEDGALYFASSLEALRRTTRHAWAVDTEALDAYLALSYVPAPRTIYRDVAKLEAGTVLVVEDGEPVAHRYWDLADDVAPFEGSYAEALDRLDELVNTAVMLRLRSDVPLGIFLSGGIDSSLVTAVAARQSPTPIQTFSIGFGVAGFDESGYAARVAQRLGTEHRLFHAEPDLLALLPELVRHFGEPYADATALPTWLLAARTRPHVTVALGGDGGDEGFAGYDWYRTAARLRRLARGIPARAFALASQSLDAPLRAAFPRSAGVGRLRRGLAILGAPTASDRFASLRSFVGAEEARLLFAGDLRARRLAGPDAASARLVGLYERCAGSALRRMRYVDIMTYLADGLMPKVDVATMAHGLEARAPLLDQEILRFALSLPDAWVCDEGGGKVLLRALLDRYLPRELFDRPKQGFTVPLRSWLVEGAHGATPLHRSERLLDAGWFSAEGLARLEREHAAGVRDHGQRLFTLLVLDEWLKRS